MAGAVPAVISDERAAGTAAPARPLGRWHRVPSSALDAGLGVLFLGLVAVEALRGPLTGAALGVLAALTVVMAACLALRRRFPLATLVVAMAALLAESFLGVMTVLSPLATLVGSYSLGQYGTSVRRRWGPLLILAGVVGVFAGTPGLSRTDPADVASVALVWLMGWGLGYSTARRREDQERTRQALERQVIAEERVRVSRELHDVVGHTVNLLVVQAGAARMSLDRDPAMARRLLEGMEAVGRSTLADLDRVLAGLRPEGAEHSGDPVPPPPGVAQLPELVARFAGSAVDVRLTVDPDLRLPRDLELSVYRIVQEALTNTLKHAAPCSAAVNVARANGSVVVEIADTGPGVGPTAARGRGLLGIAERVSLAGGLLEHGNQDSGGFRLQAVLPLP